MVIKRVHVDPNDTTHWRFQPGERVAYMQNKNTITGEIGGISVDLIDLQIFIVLLDEPIGKWKAVAVPEGMLKSLDKSLKV